MLAAASCSSTEGGEAASCYTGYAGSCMQGGRSNSSSSSRQGPAAVFRWRSVDAECYMYVSTNKHANVQFLSHMTQTKIQVLSFIFDFLRNGL